MVETVTLHVKRAAHPINAVNQSVKHITWRLAVDGRQIGSEVDIRAFLQFPDTIRYVRILWNFRPEIFQHLAGRIAGVKTLRVLWKAPASRGAECVPVLEGHVAWSGPAFAMVELEIEV